MKKLLVLPLLFSGLFASLPKEYTLLKEAFMNTVSKSEQARFEAHFQTPIFKEALTYFTDSSKLYQGERAIADPHSRKAHKTETVQLPNWPEIFKVYSKSATEEKNPVSAFYALHIMRSYLGSTRDGEKLQKRHALAKTLYEANICQGFIEWGDVHAEGIATRVDFAKANEIYTQGLPTCKALGNAWQSTVIQMKIDRTKQGK